MRENWVCYKSSFELAHWLLRFGRTILHEIACFFYHGTVIWDLMFTTFQTSCPVRSLDSKKYLLKRDSDNIRILDKTFPDYLIHLQNYTQCFFSPTYFPPEIIFLNFVFAYFCHSLGYNLCKSILFWFFLLIYPQCLEQCPNCEESLHKYLLIL